jgi:predicted NBD/HSP70 family sugar kinase
VGVNNLPVKQKGLPKPTGEDGVSVGDFDVAGGITKLRVLNEIRRREAVARVDISTATGLSRGTVTAITADLIQEGLVIELEGAPEAGMPSQRGRPRVLLSLNPDALRVVGVKVAPDTIAVSITNFIGDVVARHDTAVQVRLREPEDVARLVQEGIDHALALAGLTLAQTAGIGIGVPGFIDHASGLCRWSPVFGEADIPFGQMMAKRLGRPVLLDNDANLVALAEQWFGPRRAESDFLVVTVEHGVGMGLVLDHRLYRGALRVASEFGHTKIQQGGALCRCGQRGCVEAYVAEYAMVREAGAFMPACDISDPQATRLALDELARLAEAKDPMALDIYHRAGTILGIGLANLINILNPPLIVLSGRAMRSAHLFWEAIMAALRANTVGGEQDLPRIEVHPWGDDVWARGAAALVLDRLYQLPQNGS